MKTLDEVITSLDVCINGKGCKNCPYAVYDEDEFEEYTECEKQRVDALHYLKEYQRYQNTPSRNGHMALVDYFEETQKNEPLTWDELRTMEGKPVWVEILSDEIDLSSRWMMVSRETKAHSLPLAYTDDMGHWIYGHEDDLGKTWQAYRKER